MTPSVLVSRDDDFAGPINRGPFPFLVIDQHCRQTLAETVDAFVSWCNNQLTALVNESPKILQANAGESVTEWKRLIKGRCDYELALRLDKAKLSVHFRRCKTFRELPGVVKLHDHFAGSIDEAPLVSDVCERETFLC